MGFTNYTLKEIYDILINYIENNRRNDILCEDSIITLEQLLKEIKAEYNI